MKDPQQTSHIYVNWHTPTLLEHYLDLVARFWKKPFFTNFFNDISYALLQPWLAFSKLKCKSNVESDKWKVFI